jgi:hypothetical protein
MSTAFFLTHNYPLDDSINPPNIRSKDKVQSCVPEIILLDIPEKSIMFMVFCGEFIKIEMRNRYRPGCPACIWESVSFTGPVYNGVEPPPLISLPGVEAKVGLAASAEKSVPAVAGSQ